MKHKDLKITPSPDRSSTNQVGCNRYCFQVKNSANRWRNNDDREKLCMKKIKKFITLMIYKMNYSDFRFINLALIYLHQYIDQGFDFRTYKKKIIRFGIRDDSTGNI